MITHPADKEIAFPNAKINVGLFITSRLANGYHTLQSLFYPIDWCDVLEIVPLSDMPGECRLTVTGIVVDGDPEQNLCVKAYRLMQSRFPQLPGVHIHLEKRIPFGAGLGGGSSDGAQTLLLLRKMFALEISDREIETMAAQMGADCTFFCRQGAQYLEHGIGGELTPHPFSLRDYWLVVVKPSVGVSTREAYSRVAPATPTTPLDILLSLPIEEWRNRVVNDFETSVFPIHPMLASDKETLYRQGALYASMSGSGSALFGIFKEAPAHPEEWFPADYEVRCFRG